VLAGIAEPRAITPAEVRMLGLAGANLAATSIVPAVIAAAHAGIEVLGMVAVDRIASGEPRAPQMSEEEGAQRAREAAASKIEIVLRGLLRSVKP
jgi:purine nucleoside phosphorylase